MPMVLQNARSADAAGCFLEKDKPHVIRVGVIGYGYWGPNLVRNFADNPNFQLAAVCDGNPKRLEVAQRRYPGIFTTTDARELIEKGGVDAVAIATPVNTHFPLGMMALGAGKHLLVEK